MGKYSQFIEDVRRSRPQMPHPEEVSEWIAERTGTMPQDSPTGPAPLSSGHIRDTAVRTEISSLPVSTSAFMRGPQAHLEHYRKTNAHRQSVAGLKDRAANLQSHEDH